MKKNELSVLAGLILAFMLTACADISHRAENIRNSTLRLHIIANSDSRRDTQMKLAVKDAVAGLCSEIYCHSENLQQTISITEENMDLIRLAADSTLQKAGAGYTAQCSIEEFYFETTQYSHFTMPAGKYKALTVRLGKAEGTNWWCVAYPALCMSARAEYEDDTSNTFIETDSFRLKFKVVELGQGIRRLFDKNTDIYTHLPR